MIDWPEVTRNAVCGAPLTVVVMFGAFVCLRFANRDRHRTSLVAAALAVSMVGQVQYWFLGQWEFDMIYEFAKSSDIAFIIHSWVWMLPHSVAIGLLLWTTYRDATPQNLTASSSNDH